MVVGELDKTKCSTKFLTHNLNDDVVVNVKCYEAGTLDLRGKKEEYRIIVPDSKKPIEQILSDAIEDSYDKIKDNLEPPL